jgi:hypothetical protein
VHLQHACALLSAAAASCEASHSRETYVSYTLVLTLCCISCTTTDAGSGRRDSMNGGSGSSSNGRGHPFCYDVLTQGAGAQTLSCKCGHKYVYCSIATDIIVHTSICTCALIVAADSL